VDELEGACHPFHGIAIELALMFRLNTGKAKREVAQRKASNRCYGAGIQMRQTLVPKGEGGFPW
jgi:hypothetical protein